MNVYEPENLFDVTVELNGQLSNARVPARRLLSDFLRHDLGATLLSTLRQ